MYKINYRFLWKVILFIAIIQIHASCRKFVEIGTPPDKITQENIYSTDPTAIGVLTGIYGTISSGGVGAEMAKYGGLLGDECMLWSGADANHKAYFTNSLFATDPTINTGLEVWRLYYNYIFMCNAAIEGIINNDKLSFKVKNQLLGESYFLRSWFYFYLVNLYGDLPLAIGTDPEINRLLSRSSVQKVYQLMTDDLLKAQDLLSPDFVNGQLVSYPAVSAERVRPTKWAANALLARVYLYTGDYAKAEIESGKVIVNTTLFGILPLPGIFLKNSREAIWQLQPVSIQWNTMEARLFHLSAIPTGLSANKPVYINPTLLNAFDTNDLRRMQWVNSFVDGTGTYYFPVKYKIGVQNSAVTSPATLTEYSMMLRLGEQYLIRAEARAKQNNLSGAIADLDVIRNRAGVPLIANTNPGISQAALLDVILHERQVELFSEWGHRWFDLKRTGKVDAVMSVVAPQKGGNWESTDQLLPIPYNDLLFGVNLRQNPGY